MGDGVLRERGRLAFAGEWRGGFADRCSSRQASAATTTTAFQDFTTWRLPPAWAMRETTGLRPHASVGTAVKFPALFEQFGRFPTFFDAQSQLEAREELRLGRRRGIHASTRARLLFDVTYFHANLTNKINGFFLIR